MRAVGIRELKNRLSTYVREVRRGKSIDITDRGVVVARIVPVSAKAMTEEAIWQRLIDEGWVRPGTGEPVRLTCTGVRLPPGTAQRLLDEERAERW